MICISIFIHKYIYCVFVCALHAYTCACVYMFEVELEVYVFLRIQHAITYCVYKAK